MPEALTESFCERCGTRYEFTAPTRLNPLRKTRGLVSGLRNYIMSQDALGDAVGDAMRSEQDALAAAQLDAFHTSFNFCIDCRQYTCVNCWNDDAGRCRSCAPIVGTDDLAERIQAGLAASAIAGNGAHDHDSGHVGIEAWPTADLDEVRAPEPEPFLAAAPEPEQPPAFEPIPAAEPEPEPFVAAEPPFEPFTAAEPEPLVAEAFPPYVAPEAEPFVAAEPYVEPPVEPILAPEPEPEPEPVVAVDPEPEPEPEPTAPPVLAWDADREFELIPFPTPQVEELPSIAFAAAPELDLEETAWSVEESEPAAESTAPLTWAEAPDLAILEPELPVDAVAASAIEPEPPAVVPEPMTFEPAALEPVAASHEPVEPQVPAADDPLAAARRAQLDLLGLGDPGMGTVSDRPRQLPYRSSGASVHPAELAARLAAEQAGRSAAQVIRASMWDASAREVAGAPSAVGVQSCGGCGLSLSATARFCRRCGTRQAQPA